MHWVALALYNGKPLQTKPCSTCHFKQKRQMQSGGQTDPRQANPRESPDIGVRCKSCSPPIRLVYLVASMHHSTCLADLVSIDEVLLGVQRNIVCSEAGSRDSAVRKTGYASGVCRVHLHSIVVPPHTPLSTLCRGNSLQEPRQLLLHLEQQDLLYKPSSKRDAVTLQDTTLSVQLWGHGQCCMSSSSKSSSK